MGATFIIDQPDGAGGGVAGVARKDLWLSQQVVLTCASSNSFYKWEFMPGGIPPGSAAVIANDEAQVASFTPDVVGSYRVRLTTNGGGVGNVITRICAVTKDATGETVNRGYRLPAFEERKEEANWDSNLRGFAPDWEYIIEDVLNNAFSGGSGGGGAEFTVSCLAGLALRQVVYITAGGQAVAADATTGPEARGIVVSKPTATTATVRMVGEVTGFVGLTPGTTYFLSTTPGGITSTPPTAEGTLVQPLGVAKSGTALAININGQAFQR